MVTRMGTSGVVNRSDSHMTGPARGDLATVPCAAHGGLALWPSLSSLLSRWRWPCGPRGVRPALPTVVNGAPCGQRSAVWSTERRGSTTERPTVIILSTVAGANGYHPLASLMTVYPI
jgi:hypothetical protein